MLEEIDLQPAEKVLDRAQTMMRKIQESSYSWPNRETFEGDLKTASTLLAEMQRGLCGLVAQLSEHTNVVYGQGLESEVGEAIHKSYNLLNHLYNDLHAIRDDVPTGKDTFERAKIHFK